LWRGNPDQGIIPIAGEGRELFYYLEDASKHLAKVVSQNRAWETGGRYSILTRGKAKTTRYKTGRGEM